MNSCKYFAIFYVEALYHLPHFLPVADEMKRRGLPYVWLFSNETKKTSGSIIERLGLQLINGRPENTEADANFFIFGNGYDKVASVPGHTVLIYHGIGTKACYYEDNLDMFNIRFVEGEYRRKELDSRSPDRAQERPVVGFSKLDPTVRFSPADRHKLLHSFGLDPSRKTLLYAPTYYPSSIELMGENFPVDCRDMNLIIKPHQFTYTKKYKRQFIRLNVWKKHDNVYLANYEDFNALPFFAVSDVMISDESSTIFEFAALGRPVIRNRFVKIRPSYKLFPWKLRKRMDAGIERYSGVARDARDYKETIQILRELLANPPMNDERIRRYSHELVGEVDGKASERIVDYLKKKVVF